MRILFTICGRAGSKGIKNKNIRSFCGYPLPLYSLSAIQLYIINHSEDNCDIVVNTDSRELVDILIGNPWGIEVSIINRTENLSGDKVGKVDVIRDCYEKMTDRNKTNYDVVVDLDITSPLRTEEDVENLISQYSKGEKDVVFSVVESRRNPYFNMVRKRNNNYERAIQSDFTARQQAPEMYDMNASLYAYSPAFLTQNKGIFDSNACDIIKMYDTGILDLDRKNDFELMEIIARGLFNKIKQFKDIYQNIVVNY